jgi:CBS domain containing-hemolysin-like protein
MIEGVLRLADRSVRAIMTATRRYRMDRQVRGA